MLFKVTKSADQAIISNIGGTATLIGDPPKIIIWWALSLGACLGGNLTMIGASANIVSVGMAKKLGHEISFLDFARKSIVIRPDHVFARYRGSQVD